MWVCRGFSVLGFFPGHVLPLWGRGGGAARGMACILFTGARPPLLPLCPIPAEPGLKFKAEGALLSNSVTLPARPPSKGKAHSHTTICRASAALCFVVWRLGMGMPPQLTAVRLSFLPLPTALGLSVSHTASLSEVSDPLPGCLALTASGLTPTSSSWGFRVFLEGSLGRERPSPAFPIQWLADSVDSSCQELWSQTDLSSNPWVTLGRRLSLLQFPIRLKKKKMTVTGSALWDPCQASRRC